MDVVDSVVVLSTGYRSVRCGYSGTNHDKAQLFHAKFTHRTLTLRRFQVAGRGIFSTFVIIGIAADPKETDARKLAPKD